MRSCRLPSAPPHGVGQAPQVGQLLSAELGDASTIEWSPTTRPPPGTSRPPPVELEEGSGSKSARSMSPLTELTEKPQSLAARKERGSSRRTADSGALDNRISSMTDDESVDDRRLSGRAGDGGSVSLALEEPRSGQTEVAAF